LRLDLAAFLNNTVFRLALAQAGAFTLFVVLMVGGVYLVTAGQINRQAESDADSEFSFLEQAYSQGGIRGLNTEVASRMAAGRGGIYALANGDGVVQTGSVDTLPTMPGAESRRVIFWFDVEADDGDVDRHHARGRIGRLLGGPILLVARDMGDASALVNRITSLMWFAGLFGLAMALLVGYFTSRQAARRIAQLSRTARDVMAGDLARRAPVTGSNDEFDALSQDINAMLSRIENLVEAIRTAGDAIAHDLRSPLSRLRHQLEGALDASPDTERDRRALTLALGECERVLATFNSILKLSRLRSAANWSFHRLDVSAIAADLGDFYTAAADERGIRFEMDIALGLALNGDQNLIEQALSNLLENALKYTPPGERILLKAQPLADGRIEAAVLDSGPGVPEADRPRVRQRFVRLERARSSPGLGLGLSLVEAVAELHKGALELGDGLAREGGAGLKAALVLPAAAKPA
jgi:signal transduction histidine kinase